MANKYLRSSAAGAATGADWTNAYTDIVTAVTGMTAGDDLFVASDHTETQASLRNIAIPGTLAAPCRIICVNASSSASANATTAPDSSNVTSMTSAIATTGSGSGITFTGNFYMKGLNFVAGSGPTGTANINLSMTSAQIATFDTCKLAIGSNNAGSSITNFADNSANFYNCNVVFSATGQKIRFVSNPITYRFVNCNFSGNVVPSALFNTPTAGKSGTLIVEGSDLSGFGSARVLFQGGVDHGVRSIFSNCKLGSGVLTSNGFTTAGIYVEAIACSTDNTVGVADNSKSGVDGTLTTETTIVRTGTGTDSETGATDGVIAYSHKIVTGANCTVATPFESFPIAIPITSTGASKTATIEVITDGVTLTDKDLRLDGSYYGDSNSPLGSVAASVGAGPPLSGTNLTSSTIAWTTTGLSSPVKQKLSVSFTPQQKGFLILRVRVSKASTTLYIDPKITLS